jgi:hypothetical protein
LELCQWLSALFQAGPHQPPATFAGFVRRAAPPPFSHSSEHPAPSAACPFQFFVDYPVFLFVFFFAGWGSVCPGGSAGLSQGWLWEYRVPLICSPVGLRPPSRFGAGVWRRGRPPGFSV